CPVDYSIQVDCQGYTFNAPSLQGACDDCANGTGEDHMYEIEILENGEYTFSLCGTNPDSTFDSKLYLQTQCCRGIELGYDDDGCPTPVSALSEILCVDLLMGQIVYLDVEEFSSYTTGHEYQLDISCCIPCSLWVNCCSTEETEPNDVCPTEVDPHTIACFDTICGKVCPDTEHDVYPIVVPAMTIMTLLVSDGELCDHYPTAYVANNLLDDTCGTLGTGNTSGWILTNPTATPWNLYIDIYQTTFGHATYKIATECCDIVDYCENPIVIPPGLNYTHWENTCCATDTVPCVFADSCGDETCYDSGKDVIYEFTPTVVRSWSFIASGDGDNQIMVTTVCGDTSTCVGSADNTYTGDAEVITLVDLPINTYYISTSLYSTGCGACSLQVISPEPVTNLTAWRVGDDVVLRWGSTGAPQYSVYSDTLADGTFTTFEATVLAPSTSWTDVGIVTPGTKKYYKVYSSTP
ncbi:hypothetical protein KKB28_10590, partial [bacterium]|nr:hypothetical protein [bacterium]